MLGSILTNNGFKVYIPRIPPLKNLNINQINIQWFICFYKWILKSEKVKPEHILMAGMSYGGGLMLRMLKEIQNTLPLPKTILTFGTYSNAQSLLNFYLTGKISANGKQIHIPPHEWGLIVIFQNFLKNLKTNWDSSELQRVIQAKIQDYNTDTKMLIKDLPEFQKEIFHSIMSGEASQEVKELTQKVLINEEGTYKDLSPKYWANEISEKIFIIHGSNDSMVPYTESIQLAEYLPNTELCISYLYEHNEISSNGGIIFKIKELIKLVQFNAKLFTHYED